MEQVTTKFRWDELSAENYPSERGCSTPSSSRDEGTRWSQSKILAIAAELLSMHGNHALPRALTALIVLVSCGISLLLGLPHTSIYGHDVFIALDGGWRVLAGQRPHVDFYSAFGAVAYLIPAAGLWLAKLRVEGLSYSTVAVGLLLGFWATLISTARLKAWAAVLFTSFVVLFWLAPFPLGEPYYLPSYAMQYNRLGYALLSIAMIELFVPARRSLPGFLHWGGLSTGVILALLLFLKISFFAVGIVVVASALILFSKSWKQSGSVIIGFLFLALLLLGYLHWDIPAIWTDLNIAAHARTARFHSGGDPIRTVFRNLTEIATLSGFALLAVCFSDSKRTARGLWTKPRIAAFAMLLLSADLLLAIGNTQRSGFPLTLVAMLILANSICGEYLQFRAASRDLCRLGSVVVACAAALAVLPYMSDTINGWGVVLMRNVVRRSDAPTLVIDAAPLRGLKLDDHSDPTADLAVNNGTPLVANINEGLSLIRSHSDPRQSIACLCFSNPFSYALLRAPALGGSTFFADGTNFTRQSAPSAARILGNSELVIYPNRKTGDDGVDTLLQICGSQLAMHYRLLAHSEHWTLLKRINRSCLAGGDSCF